MSITNAGYKQLIWNLVSRYNFHSSTCYKKNWDHNLILKKVSFENVSESWNEHVFWVKWALRVDSICSKLHRCVFEITRRTEELWMWNFNGDVKMDVCDFWQWNIPEKWKIVKIDVFLPKLTITLERLEIF